MFKNLLALVIFAVFVACGGAERPGQPDDSESPREERAVPPAAPACWESVGKPCSRIGEFMAEGGLHFDEEARGRWFGRSVAKIPECLGCAYALFCGGGCAQYSEYNTATLYKPYCDDFQRTFSDVIAEELDFYLERQLSKPIG